MEIYIDNRTDAEISCESLIVEVLENGMAHFRDCERRDTACRVRVETTAFSDTARLKETTGLLRSTNFELSLSFVTREEIRALNQQYRGIDKETDVLSFPFYDSFDDIPDDLHADMPIALGDIIICPDIARGQADTYGHSFEREMAFLAVHGFLHLLGYDHTTPTDEAAMRQAQREILDHAKIQ